MNDSSNGTTVYLPSVHGDTSDIIRKLLSVEDATMRWKQSLSLVTFYPAHTVAWLSPAIRAGRPFRGKGSKRMMLLSESDNFESLLDMDVVLFSRNGGETRELGAVQENGTIAPLSAWTLEPAYGDVVEFVVDEELRFPGLTATQVEVIEVLDERAIGYGSRQVGGGKGPRNPHGEESELVYYIERTALCRVELVVNPDLEINW